MTSQLCHRGCPGLPLALTCISSPRDVSCHFVGMPCHPGRGHVVRAVTSCHRPWLCAISEVGPGCCQAFG